MKCNETTAASFATTNSAGTQKIKRFFGHPFTFIVLVWVFLWLAFYVANKFI